MRGEAVRAGLDQPGEGKAEGHPISQLMVVVIEETKPDSKDRMGKRKDAMGSRCNTGNLFRNKGNCFLTVLREVKHCSRCLEGLRNLHACRYLKLDWMSPWATDLLETCSAGGGTDVSTDSFQLELFCDSMN